MKQLLTTKVTDSHKNVLIFSMFFVPVGEKIWIDGLSTPDMVSADHGITGKGVKTYADGVWIVGNALVPHYDDPSILHANMCECFQTLSAAKKYWKHNVIA